MKIRYTRSFLHVVIFAIVLSAGALKAEAQDCSITITKVSSPPTGDLFDFTADVGNGVFEFSLSGTGQSEIISFDQSSPASVTEQESPEWTPIVTCEFTTDVSFVINVEGNGVEATCLAPGGELSCTFLNLQAPGGGGVATVPTLSEWGIISTAIGLGLIGVFFVVRRRRAVNS